MSFIWFEYTTLRLGQNKFFSFTSWTVNVFIKNHIEKGEALHDAMKVSAYYPDTLLNMIAIGEKSGSLEKMLTNAVNFYKSSLTRQIDCLSKLIEPILLTFIALIVGFLLIALYYPLLNYATLI